MLIICQKGISTLLTFSYLMFIFCYHFFKSTASKRSLSIVKLLKTHFNSVVSPSAQFSFFISASSNIPLTLPSSCHYLQTPYAIPYSSCFLIQHKKPINIEQYTIRYISYVKSLRCSVLPWSYHFGRDQVISAPALLAFLSCITILWN